MISRLNLLKQFTLFLIIEARYLILIFPISLDPADIMLLLLKIFSRIEMIVAMLILLQWAVTISDWIKNRNFFKYQGSELLRYVQVYRHIPYYEFDLWFPISCLLRQMLIKPTRVMWQGFNRE